MSLLEGAYRAVVAEVKKPVPAPGEILGRVEASAVNRADLHRGRLILLLDLPALEGGGLAIFGKTDAPGGQPEVPELASRAAASVATVIGPKARFVGEFTGDEDLVIQGRFEGNIDIRRRVTVAPSGEMKGDIHARSVIVGGRVQGEILADERAELLASASVQGNVNAPKVVIAEGAQLQGTVAMSTVIPIPTKEEK